MEELFYSIPQAELCVAVRECIETKGPVAFQNSSGLSIDNFLELLSFYLSSTIVDFNNDSYVQKQGICIGSCIAPVLSDLFLACIDKEISSRLNKTFVAKIFRFVDDYLVLLKGVEPEGREGIVESVFSMFQECGKGLKFTREVPVEGCLQYLDLSISFKDSSPCWTYCPRSKKSILNYNSAHSKLVKRGIAMNCLRAALQKSCEHKMNISVQQQVLRLRSAGFPDSTLTSVAESLIKEVRHGSKTAGCTLDASQGRPVSVPYMHNLSHRLKKVAGKCGVRVVFSAPRKMSRMCRRVNSTEGVQTCGTRHATQFVNCSVGVVYLIPLSCGKCYIGQTGQCLNERLRKHRTTVAALMAAGNLAAHCRKCTVINDGKKKKNAPLFFTAHEF